MPFPTSHGAFACCGFKTSVQVIKKKKGGGGDEMSFLERQKILQALWHVSHKGLFVHG